MQFSVYPANSNWLSIIESKLNNQQLAINWLLRYQKQNDQLLT